MSQEPLNIHQPTLSQPQGLLRAEGVVATWRQGKNIYDRIADPAMLDIVAVRYRLYFPKEHEGREIPQPLSATRIASITAW